MKTKRTASFCILAIFIMVSCTVSCRESIGSIEKTELFKLDYGFYDNQIPLFMIDVSNMEAHMAMRDGIFYITAANTGKLMILSSYGELLQLVYNEEKNPRPTLLTITENVDNSKGLQGRIAYSYPFIAPKKIAIDSKQNIYIEDSIPPERVRIDPETGIVLQSVIQKISLNKGYIDYIGQEGIGGTPFSYIDNIFCTNSNELVVITQSDTGYIIYYYDASGKLITSLAVTKTNLFLPVGNERLIPILDTVYPELDGTSLFIKIDYFENMVNKETQTVISMNFIYSIIWKVDRNSGKMIENYKIEPFIGKSETNKTAQVHKRSWSLAGYARKHLFLYGISDKGETMYALYNCDSKHLSMYTVKIDNSKLQYADFNVSNDGIVSALLCGEKDISVVWWRFDKLLEGIPK